MFSLPLPASGRIRRICHISDIHIRPGTDNKDPRLTRAEEYEAVFDRIVRFLKAEGGGCDDMVICITGDVLHDNKKLGATALSLFFNILNKLAALAPVYVIRGNHDYNQASMDDQDLLTPLVDMLGASATRVAYLKDSGTYRAGDVAFGLVAIQDALRAGNTCGRCEELPPFPEPDATARANIALFHGDVPKQYPIEWFGSGYDFVLLGDLHKFQLYNGVPESNKILMEPCDGLYLVNKYTRVEGKTMWGYPGSTIQQNHGETLSCHGLVVWDLEERTAQVYHVPNDYGFVTMRKGDRGYDINLSFPQNDRICDVWVEANKAMALPWFPKILRLRIKREKGEGLASSFDAVELVKELGCHVETACEVRFDADGGGVGEGEGDGSGEGVGIKDVHQFNEPATWIEYIRRTVPPAALTYDGWTAFFADPHALKLALPHDAGAFLEKDLRDRSDKIQSAIKAYQDSLVVAGAAAHSKFELVYMNWAWILCFRDNNYFDFQRLKGKVHCISGKNGDGKSSFIQTIFTAMFGEDIPSRTSPAESASLICQSKPAKQSAMTSIVFAVNDKRFRIQRVFDTQAGNKLQSKDVVLEEWSGGEGGGFKEVHSGKLATRDWLDKNVGSSESFLTSCILTQAADADFFTRKTSGGKLSQKHYLDQQLHLDSSSRFLELLKVAGLAYDHMCNKLDTILCVKKGEGVAFDVSELEAREAEVVELEARLEEIDREVGGLKKAWEGVSEGVLKHGRVGLVEQRDRCVAELGGVEGDGGDLEVLVQQKATLEAAFESVAYALELGVEPRDVKPLVPRPVETREELGGSGAGVNLLGGAGVNPRKELATLILCEADRDRVAAKIEVLCEEQPPMPNISQQEYENWIQELACFEQGEGSFRELEAQIEGHVAPVKKPTLDLERERARLNKWRATSGFIMEDLVAEAEGSSCEEWAVAKERAEQKAGVWEERVRALELEAAGVEAELAGVMAVKPPLGEVEGGVGEIDIDFVNAVCNHGDALRVRRENARKEIARVSALLASCEKHAFNPACAACMSHPWKKRMDEAEGERSAAQAELEAVEAEMRARFKGQVLESTEVLEECRKQASAWAWNEWKAKQDAVIGKRAAVLKERGLARAGVEAARLKVQQRADGLKRAEERRKRCEEWRTEFGVLEKEIADGERDERLWKAWELEHSGLVAKREAWVKLLLREKAMTEQVEARRAYARWRDVMAGAVAEREALDERLKRKAELERMCKRLDLDAWEAWDAFVARELEEKIQEVESEIDRVKKRLGVEQELERVIGALGVVDDYERCKALEEERARCVEARGRVGAMVEELRAKKASWERNAEVMARLEAALEVQRSVAGTVRVIVQEFETFKDWVLRDKVLPVLKAHVNRLLAFMCKNHRPLELDCVFEDKGDFYWRLQDGKHAPPLEKASGFQRFVVGLAMRIALGRLGVSGIRNTQLFIDEGFTACDQENLSVVPDVLGKLSEIYDAVVIVSHLEELKHGIRSFIGIQRDPVAGVSCIQYGEFDEGLAVVKKVGRPKGKGTGGGGK